MNIAMVRKIQITLTLLLQISSKYTSVIIGVFFLSLRILYKSAFLIQNAEILDFSTLHKFLFNRHLIFQQNLLYHVTIIKL